ncbi:hypothetical protein SLEP1_g15059 [Rubroshorea leprosula]|uniref:Uncharacterized protein n=1 Tax=Rubroshorea leprosula TaxID=152421 RepID=A0AAV5IU08_9ROSI|nr:hypothetical protein SLEP1_g15059 [Rubroshorea leprosula]
MTISCVSSCWINGSSVADLWPALYLFRLWVVCGRSLAGSLPV